VTNNELDRVRAWRHRLVYGSPAIIAFFFLLGFLNEPTVLERVIVSLVGGLLIQGVGLLVFFVTSYALHRMAGTHLEVSQLGEKNYNVTAAVLLAVAVWILGHHWATKKVETIIACVRDPVSHGVGLLGSPSAADLVRWCSNESISGGYQDLE